MSGQVSSGEAQAAQALESLKFELLALGFQMTDTPAEADALADFSIGQIRYDPLVGWIADQAVLTFKDPSGKVLAGFRAQSRGITPTVNNIVTKLSIIT